MPTYDFTSTLQLKGERGTTYREIELGRVRSRREEN
jgi:hypothetical protein